MIMWLIIGLVVFIAGLFIAQHYELEHTMYRQQWPSDFDERRRWENRMQVADTASDALLIDILRTHYDYMYQKQFHNPRYHPPAFGDMPTPLMRKIEYVRAMIKDLEHLSPYEDSPEYAEYADEIRSAAREWIFSPYYLDLLRCHDWDNINWAKDTL